MQTKFTIVQPGFIPEGRVALVNRAYEMWQNDFGRILKKHDHIVHPEDFWRAQLIVILHDENEIIALNTVGCYDLRTKPGRQDKYISSLPAEVLESCQQHQINTLHSIEWYLVNSKYRGHDNVSDIKWADIHLALNFQLVAHSPWDSFIGVCRDDLKVNKKCAELGSFLSVRLEKYGYICDIMLCRGEQVKAPRTDIRFMVESIWKNMEDHTGLFQSKQLAATGS